LKRRPYEIYSRELANSKPGQVTMFRSAASPMIVSFQKEFIGHPMLAIETKSAPASGYAISHGYGAPALPSRSASIALPAVLTLIVVTLFVPIELSFYVFGLRLTLTRLIFLIIAPFLFVKFMNKLTRGRYRFVFSDFFICCTGIWMLYAAANIDGIEGAVSHAGPEILELAVAYFAARTLLSEPGQAALLITRLCQAIAIVALIGLLDPLTGRYVSREIAAQLSGYAIHISQWDDAYRLGLLRASGPIEHPILFGFVCATGLLFSASIAMRGRLVIMTACGLGAIFSFSSAPVQSILIGLVLLLYARLTPRMPFRWTLLLVLAGMAIFAAFLISNNPLGFIISNLIFTPASGYYRYWTWVTVLAHISYSPWFGLGYGVLPEEINHTIDALWLILAIHAGFPGAALTFLSLVGASSLPTSRKKANLSEQEERLGLILGIVVALTVFIALTVHFWGSVWVLTGLLAGTRAQLGELGRLSFLASGNRPHAAA
jgi:hypothetical protein